MLPTPKRRYDVSSSVKRRNGDELSRNRVASRIWIKFAASSNERWSKNAVSKRPVVWEDSLP